MHDQADRYWLNPTRRTVVALVAEGFNNKDIAARAGTTENVVKQMLRKLYDRLGFWNRTELAMWYVKKQHDGEIDDWLK